MVLSLFESAEQRRRDEDDLQSLHKKFGGDTVTELASRAGDDDLSDRDRKHWTRLLRKARQRYKD